MLHVRRAFPHQPQQLLPAIKSRRLSLACASLSNVVKPDARSLGCFFDLNSAILDPALLLVYLAPLASSCHQSYGSGL